MRRILDLPVIRPLHERRLLFPAILGAAVLAVLIHGAFSPHTEETETAAAPRAVLTVPGLRPGLEKTPLDYQADYWRQLAENVRNKFVLVGPNARPAIMVAPGVALGSLAAARDLHEEETIEESAAVQAPQPAGEAATETPDGPDLTPSARLMGMNPDLGVALFAVKQPAWVDNFPAVNALDIEPGAYVAAVSLAGDGSIQIIPGHVVSVTRPTEPGSGSLEVDIPFPDSFRTAALVDLDGTLVAAAVPVDEGMQVVPAEGIPLIVAWLSRGEACQAIETGDLSDAALDILGLRHGVLVERVRPEAFQPEPSIQEGDILLSWNGQDVTSAAEFAQQYSAPKPGSLVRYRVLRNGRVVAGSTRLPGPDCRPAGRPPSHFPALGLTIEWVDPGWRVMRVAEDSLAARVGVQEDDLIIAVGGRRTSEKDLAAFRSFERDPRPLLLTVRRLDRVRVLAVLPASEQGEAASPAAQAEGISP